MGVACLRNDVTQKGQTLRECEGLPPSGLELQLKTFDLLRDGVGFGALTIGTGWLLALVVVLPLNGEPRFE